MGNFLLKLVLILQFSFCYCTIYYDDGNSMEQTNEGDEEEGDFRMLISGGYHLPDPLFEKYMVSIRTRRPTEFFGDNHYCAATVIGTRMLITAGHCVVDSLRIKTRPRRIAVMAGTPNRLHHVNTSLELLVDKIIVHPDFRREGLHDLALIRLQEDIPFENPAIRIMSLANEKPTFNQSCTVVGWGQLFKYGPYAAKIVYAIVNIHSNESCMKAYGDKYNSIFNLCASNLNDFSRDACYGDSGGPLVCANRLSGIISWGVNCGESNLPTVFTDVFSHRDWVYRVTNGKNFKNPSVHLAISLIIILYLFNSQIVLKL